MRHKNQSADFSCWAAFPTSLIAFTLMAFGLLGCRFNLAGYLTEPPLPSEVIGHYSINAEQAKHTLKGYDDLSGNITIEADGTFKASQIPACCVHGLNESSYPFSGGYYSLTGNWKVIKESAVYVVRLEITNAALSDVPSTTSPTLLRERHASKTSRSVHLMRGDPLSLGFPIFSGDFYDIVFLRVKKQG